MARKHKYPRRPWNDGDHWIDGVYHARGRQKRSTPRPTHTHTQASKVNTGVDHVSKWRTLSKDSVMELALRGVLSPEWVERYIKRGVWERSEFRQEFLKGVKEMSEAGECTDAMGLFNRYRVCLLNK